MCARSRPAREQAKFELGLSAPRSVDTQPQQTIMYVDYTNLFKDESIFSSQYRSSIAGVGNLE